MNRLVHVGVPQTYESAVGAGGGQGGAADGENIAEATQVLITAMDAVKLDYKSVDEVRSCMRRAAAAPPRTRPDPRVRAAC